MDACRIAMGMGCHPPAMPHGFVCLPSQNERVVCCWLSCRTSGLAYGGIEQSLTGFMPRTRRTEYACYTSFLICRRFESCR
jgi:hypothetical protein